MQITIEVSDDKSAFVLELLASLPFVNVKEGLDDDTAPEEVGTNTAVNLSPKTAALLGAFPMLASVNEDAARQQAIQNKHLR